MADTELAAETEADGKKTRERSSIKFPYVDLEAAIALPNAMHGEQGAAACDLDQLSSWSGHETPNSGTFRNKVQAARYFGLVKVEHHRVTLTPLGRDILDPHKAPSARARAFLAVPLYKKLFDEYRGRALPPDIGLENQIKILGVAAKQADKARQAFRRSAQQAGFFAQGTDRLVMPANVDVAASPPDASHGDDADATQQQRRGKGGGAARPGGMHPMIRMVLTMLPPAGEAWSADEQEVWLDLLRGVFTRIYPAPTEGEATE